MSTEELGKIVRNALYAVAPGLEDETINPDETFRDQFEFDSMDYLNFIIGLNNATGLSIPEADYPKLQTVSGCTADIRDAKKQHT